MSHKLQVQQALDGLRSVINDPVLAGSEYSVAMGRVIDVMEQHADTPASTRGSKHGAFEGGLIVHSYQVYRIMDALCAGTGDYLPHALMLPEPYCRDSAALGEQLNQIKHPAPFTVALLHDLNKLRDLAGRAYYVPNMIKNGTVQSEKVPWEINKAAGPFACLREKIADMNSEASCEPFGPEFLAILQDDGVTVRDGLVSLAVATQISPELNQLITPDQKFAIMFHDGAYAGRTNLTGKENLLQILLHAADMVASKFVC